jgi:hypothetical protein
MHYAPSFYIYYILVVHPACIDAYRMVLCVASTMQKLRRGATHAIAGVRVG